MVGLVIEKVHQQAEEILVGAHAAHIAVMQAMVQVGLLHAVAPIDNQLIQPGAMGCQLTYISKSQLFEIGRRSNNVQRSQRCEACWMLRKTLEPDGVAQDQMVQRAEDRAEKRLSIHRQFRVRQCLGRVIELAVHPLVVIRHQCDVLSPVHLGFLSKSR